MIFSTLFLVVVAASVVTGKPVSEASGTTPAADEAPATVSAIQPDASVSAIQPDASVSAIQPDVSVSAIQPDVYVSAVQPDASVSVVQSDASAELLVLAEEPALVLEALPVEAEVAEEALVVGHRHARCRLVRATPTRYAPSRRRQGYYYQRPYYTAYRPFRPRPAYLRPLQEEQPLQIVY